MHISVFQKSQIISHLSHVGEHHTFATLLSIFVGLFLVYSLNSPKYRSAGSVRHLSYIDHPQHTHEYERRATYIYDHLERLRHGSRADRVYLLAYRYGSSRFGGIMELQIATAFEVGQERLPYQLEDYQNLSRRNWLRLACDNSTTGSFLPGPIPHSYGLELYDTSGRPVGYIGMEYWQEQPTLTEYKLPLLRKTAAEIRDSLLAPLEALTPL